MSTDVTFFEETMFFSKRKSNSTQQVLPIPYLGPVVPSTHTTSNQGEIQPISPISHQAKLSPSSISTFQRRTQRASSIVQEDSLDSCPFSSANPTRNPFPSSLSHIAEVEVLESLLHHESPLSPLVATTLSYTRSGGRATITVRINAFGNNNYLDDESTVIPMPPPPPESGVSWDFFDPIEDSESFSFAVHCS